MNMEKYIGFKEEVSAGEGEHRRRKGEKFPVPRYVRYYNAR